MIDFKEIGEFEKFEDLCEELLLAKGLQVRRLGRGPSQRGKDIIARESYIGTLSAKVVKNWLVEVKFTLGNRSLNENDVPNVLDRVKSQEATGYFLFTNARLGVNLEQTLTGLGEKGCIDILIWRESAIEKEVLNDLHIFRKYFPISYKNWIQQNRYFLLNQVKLCKSPLTCILAALHLIRGLLDKPDSTQIVDKTILNSAKLVRSLIDEMDDFLANIYLD